MAILAPIAGALLGSAIGGAVGLAGTALTIATSIGWLAGTAIQMALTRPKPTVTDPGAQQFVPINQSVRGLTIPILFGTNRVNSMIVYQGNFITNKWFTVQKSGGSFGFGGQKTFTANYNYTVDQIFHFGMPLSAVAINKGWVDDKPMSNATVTGLNAGVESLASLITASAPDAANAVSLSYSSVFFSTGTLPMDDDSGFSVFQGLMGSAVTWPGTSFLALKGFSLGGATYIPTLSFEIGPAATEIDPATHEVEYSDYTYDIPYQIGGFSVDGWAVWSPVIAYGGGDVTRFMNLDGREVVYSSTTLEADFPSMATGRRIEACGIVGKGQYFVALWASGFTSRAVTVWSIDENAVLTPLGWAQHEYAFFFDYYNRVVPQVDDTLNGCQIRHGGTEELTDVLYICINSTQNAGDPTGFYMGTLASWIASNNSPSLLTNMVRLNFNNMFGYFDSGDPGRGFVLPVSTIVDDVPVMQDWWILYIKKSKMTSSTFLTTLSATRPNGAFIGAPLVNTGAAQDFVDMSDSFVLPSGTTVIPFTDIDKYTDGSSNPGADYYDSGIVPSSLGDSARLIILAKYDGIAGVASQTDSYAIRIFIWEPGTNLATQYVNDVLTPHDHSDFAVVGSQSIRYQQLACHYFEADRSLWIAGGANYTGPGSSPGSLYHSWWIKLGTLEFAQSDLTPPEIIREVLAHPYFGVGYDYDDIDSTTYAAAVAFCNAHNFVVSTQYRATGSALSTLEQLLQIYGGYLNIDAGLNSIKFGFQEYTAVSVRTIDNDHLVVDAPGTPPISVTKGALQDTVNKVRVNYQDRNIDYKQNQVEEADEVDQDLHGVRLKEFPAQFVMQQSTARSMALRALMHNLYMRDVYNFRVGWKDADLEPGDVVTLVDSFSSLNTIARIVNWQEKKRGIFEVTAQQELETVLGVYDVGSFTIATSASVSGQDNTLYPPFYQQMYELPEPASTNGGIIYTAWASGGAPAGATLYISDDGTTYSFLQQGEPYPAWGRFGSGLANNPAVVTNVTIYLHPRSLSVASGDSFWHYEDFPDVSAAGRGDGESRIWVGSEMMAYEGLTLVSSNVYTVARLYRGWGGTQVAAHNSGDLFAQHPLSIQYVYTPEKIGRTIYYKVVPYNHYGVAVDIASVTASQFTIQGLAYVPKSPPTPSWVQSGTDYRGTLTWQVDTPGDITVAWKDSSRVGGYGYFGYDKDPAGYGGFALDPSSNHWRVEVYGSGGLLVHSEVVTNSFFTYSRSSNVAENGAWRGRLGFKLYHRNQYGDNPNFAVASLNLFT